MRIGISAAQSGRLADPAAVRVAARAAEQIGYSTLWVVDRLPVTETPRSGERQLGLPDSAPALDPFVVLAASAAISSRVRIGTNVLVAPWYPPVLLARALASLDVLSEGRLTVGLGVEPSLDDVDAVAAANDGHRQLDLILDALEHHWCDGDERARVAPAAGLLRPVQRPRPPLLLAADTPKGIDRVARRADGWMPEGLPIDVVASLWQEARDRAAGYGRDPDAMELVVRADIGLVARPVGGERAPYHGSLEQVIDDVEATRIAGADEVVLGLRGDPLLDEALDTWARIAEAVGLPGAASRTG